MPLLLFNPAMNQQYRIVLMSVSKRWMILDARGTMVKPPEKYIDEGLAVEAARAWVNAKTKTLPEVKIVSSDEKIRLNS